MPLLASEQAFQSRTELIAHYSNNARLLYALQIKFQIDDIDSVATDALTDGPDDKKCDLIYVNRDDSYAVIAQSYESVTPCGGSAPSNKASDLNTTVTWLLNSPIDQVPSRIRAATEQLRNVIKDGKIKRIFIWYVHNCKESKECAKELSMVERTAHAAIHQNFPQHSIEIQSFEVGQRILEEWYQPLNSPILVSDEFLISIPQGYESIGADWSAYYTGLKASVLYKLYKDHGTKLFSANIRDYLGSINTDKNINNNIKMTAKEDPGHFSIYNNGITALVNDFKIIKTPGQDNRLKISGISIVNGAQTTGAIGSLLQEPDPSASVSIRFVKCADQDVIWKIIQYNNSQNKITASDFRSNDQIQNRLREEFAALGDILYLGGRRGGVQDRIRRPSNLIPSDSVAQALTSYHGEPGMAYNEKSKLWADDANYNAIFSEKTHANHIIFAYSLLKCIEQVKMELREKSQRNDLTDVQLREFTFLRNRGATYLLHAAIAKSVETIINQPVPDKFRLSFSSRVSPSDAVELWKPIVGATIPFCELLNPGVLGGIQSRTEVNAVIRMFNNIIESTKSSQAPVFQEFARHVKIN